MQKINEPSGKTFYFIIFQQVDVMFILQTLVSNEHDDDLNRYCPN